MKLSSQPETERPATAGGGRAAVALATVTGNAFLVVGSLFFGVLSLLVSWIPPRGNWVFLCARSWARGVLLASGVRARPVYAGLVAADRPVVYMANHQSLFDIPLLLATLPGQTRMLAKRSLFRIPIFGWAIRAGGFIAIDRRDRSHAGESFQAAVDKLRTGVSALVFPEGTRSLDGRVAALQRGGFLLAIKSGLPIVPVGIEGSLARQPKGRVTIRPGEVPVRYGTPIDPAEFGLRGKDELMRRVRGEMAELAGTSCA